MQTGKASDSEWKDNFWMTRRSFYKLCDQLRPVVTRQVTNMGKPIDVIFYAGHGCQVQVIANSLNALF